MHAVSESTGKGMGAQDSTVLPMGAGRALYVLWKQRNTCAPRSIYG